MLSSLGVLFDSFRRGRQSSVVTVSGDQNYERDILLDDTLKMDRKEINDVIERNSSRHDSFFDNRLKNTSLNEAFDGFADEVIIDDRTKIDFKHIDDELSKNEYYD